MTTTASDAVIIGAGVIGSSIAYALAAQGRSVTVIDKAGAPGHGSTSASSAIIRFSYSTLSGVGLAWESHHCWEEWESFLGGADPAGMTRFHRIGMLSLDVPVVARRPVLDHFDALGIPYEEFDADGLAARFPMLDNGRHWPNKPVTDPAFWDDPAGAIGGYLTPDAGYIDDPQLAAQNLAVAARRHGASYLLNTTVAAIDRAADGTWTVRSAAGDTVSAPVVVNAAGPWSTKVNELAQIGSDFTVSVRPLRQEVHYTRAPAGTAAPPAIGDLDLGTYMRPAPGGGFLVGGTEPECDPFEWIDDPDEADPRVSVDRFEAQLYRAARRLPELPVPNRPSGVAGVYDVAADWTPIYDRTEAPGFYVAMGTSGNQFKNAPMVGVLMAHLITEVEAGRDHDADPVTYTGPRTGAVIDLGTFSRRRTRNSASSGTVMG